MHVNIFAIICLEFWQISTHVLSSSDPKLIYLSGIGLPYRNTILSCVWDLYSLWLILLFMGFFWYLPNFSISSLGLIKGEP